MLLKFLRSLYNIQFKWRIFTRWFLCIFDLRTVLSLITVNFRCAVKIFQWLLKLSNLKYVLALVGKPLVLVLKKLIRFFQSSFKNRRLTFLSLLLKKTSRFWNIILEIYLFIDWFINDILLKMFLSFLINIIPFSCKLIMIIGHWNELFYKFIQFFLIFFNWGINICPINYFFILAAVLCIT